MKNIHYIGFYSKSDNPHNFRSFPAAETKMDYIISALKEGGFSVSILALGETVSKNKFFSQKKLNIDEQEKIQYVSSFSNTSFILKFLSRTWLLMQLLYYLLFVVEKNGDVLYYHTYATMRVVKIAKLLKKFTLILEVEEIYQAAWKGSDKKIKKEIRYLKNGNKYIFVNEIMPKKLCIGNRPFAVCYGDYRTNTNRLLAAKDNDIINIVYAGVLGNENSDVALAIETIKFLPLKFQMHILGYGSDQDIVYVKNRIKDINSIYGKQRVYYHGKLSGQEYLNFLSTCHIGLSTRVLTDDYSDYTFPSKVLVYLGNNLRTVSSLLNCIVKSKVSESIYFFKESNPQSVAQTILKIDLNDNTKQGIEVLKKLDLDFINQISYVLNYKV